MEGRSSNDLCSTYFSALRTTSPKAYKFYSGLGATVEDGYDICMASISEFKYRVAELHTIIKEHPDLMVKDANDYLRECNKELFCSHSAINCKLWIPMLTTNKASTYKAYSMLKEAVRILEEFLTNKNISTDLEVW